MRLTTSELVYISEAGKALKQRDFILIDNAMIGLDNIQNIISYTLLDNNFFINHFNGAIINQKELSAFVKTISIESDFQIDFINGITKINTISGGELTIKLNQSFGELACDRFKYATLLNNAKIAIPVAEIPDIALKLQNMSKSDGFIGVDYNGYYMTLFPSILPINKSDKMYVTIFQPYTQLNTFIAKFDIKKKKFNIVTYINYLKI